VSVYTRINISQLKFFFDRYDLGSVIDFKGIANGIDNSNYFVETSQGHFVLTLFETLKLDEVPHFIKLLTRLINYRIPCPNPQFDKQSQAFRLLNDKPAAIFKRLSGNVIQNPTEQHCQQVGLQLAEIHDCTQDYEFPFTNPILTECWMLFDKVTEHLTAADRSLIKNELNFQTSHYPENLPKGVIHADLFRDNVLFDGDKLTGVLDFYSACKSELLFDIAVTVNDWCVDNGELNSDKVAELLAAYEILRPLESQEKQHWQTVLRIAALRFWLSRLVHQHYPRAGAIIQPKDPLFFRQLLEQHRSS
jgi:homoserine kinase type II